MFKNKTLFYEQSFLYLFLTIIVSLSFCIYSSMFYPLLNSDDALNILMAHYYKLPNDIYCWGQNRGGTLIPLISQFFIKIFGIPAYISVSISNYIILILGYFGFSSMFKTNYIKLLFAFVWFFPPIHFIDLLRFPIGVEYSLIGFSILFFQKLDFNRNNLKNHLYLILIILLFLLSQWVSDLSIVTISILLFSFILFSFIETGKLFFRKTIVLYSIIGASLISFLIYLAKMTAMNTIEQYVMLNNVQNVGEAIRVFVYSVKDILLFNYQSVVYSFYSWMFIVVFMLLVSFFFRERKNFDSKTKKWAFLFILDFIMIFFILIISKWVLLNGMGRWYFVALYVSASIFILLLIDNLHIKGKLKPFFKALIVFVVFVGSMSTPINLKFVSPKSFRPELSLRSEFLQLGEIGVISEYWNSYITSAKNPDLIKATPHDMSGAVRNYSIVDEVFKQPNIYVIKDMWFDVFPDTLYQFGRVLSKEGDEFQIGGCNTCKYRIEN